MPQYPQAAYSTDRDTLYRNTDPTHPDQYLLAGAENDRGFVTCYVHIPVTRRDGAVVFRAAGRTSIYKRRVLQATGRFVEVPRPFVLVRDDGHEITYG